MADTPSVSVVVLSKDEPQIERTLLELRPQCEDVGAECVVVDASRGRLDHVRTSNPWVVWIDFVGPLGVNVTIPHQRNAGVRRSRGAIVAFCDAGGSPEPGWLAALIAPIVEGCTEATCGPILPVARGIMDPANDLPDGAPVLIAITANMAFLRSAFDDAGGFDERYRYGSDTDFGFRLLDRGFHITCAAQSRMLMDWGDQERSVKRARYYGKGNVLLFLSHPRRAWIVVRLWPDTLAYPVWIMGMVVSLGLAVVAWWIPVAWALLLAVPIARNRRAPNPAALFRVKFERAFSFLTGWVTVPLHRDVPVIVAPENHENPYLDTLCGSLARAGVATTALSAGPTPSQTVNSWLVAPRLTWRRMRGAQILHLHWTYGFAWRWSSRMPLLRRAARWWFGLVLTYCRLIGLRIVYTAHNVLPHQQIFDDDVAARRVLLRSSREVITLTAAARDRLEQEFDVPVAKLTVIPEATPTATGSASPPEAAAGALAVSFGHLDSYKGPDLLLEAAQQLAGSDTTVDVELLGASSDDAFARQLDEGIVALRSAGARVTWTNRQFERDELDGLLARASLVALPFREITSSGSLLHAMAHGVPCVIPELPALADVPRDAAFWFAPGDARDLARAILELLAAPPSARRAVVAAASEWLARWDWDKVAVATRSVYERALR